MLTPNPSLYPPPPQHRDGVEIFDSQDIQMSQIGRVCELSISDIFPEDEGDYSCTATNSLGEATVECYVVVDGEFDISTLISYLFLLV